jgi:hypothetical protein
MDWALIYWYPHVYTLEKIDKADEQNDFYAILGAKRGYKEWRDLDLLYIGMAFRQTVKERIMQPHEAYTCINEYLKDNPGREIIIMVGMLVDYSLDRVTEQFVEDIECCLIHSNQPWCNERCKTSYTARPLLVLNDGDYAPLKKKSHCG